MDYRNMEPKRLLLLNAAAIVVISFLTDHWIQVSYRISRVPTYCTLQQLQGFQILRCNSDRRLMTTQCSNLFRQCNDLTDGLLGNLSRWGLFYGDSCIMVLQDRRWRFHACSLRNDVVAAVFGVSTLFLQAISLYLCRVRSRAKKTAYVLFASTVSYAGAIITTVLNIYRINGHSSVTVIDALLDSWVKAEPGWSILTATLGTIITAICAYLYIISSMRDRIRMRTMRRRRLMQTAITYSCQQEVALAVRAKMTVI